MLATLVLWQIPRYGDLILYPFSLLASYAHEMGHGLTAMLLGGRFESLELFSDGSGLAHWSGSLGRVGRAVVAAGGLMGPSVAGASLLVLSRHPSRSRALLVLIGVGMVLTAFWVARTGFGFTFLSAVGGAVGLAGWRLGRAPATFLVQLIGAQLCIALFRDVRYMFSAGGAVGGSTHVSDSAVMAEALLLPYWFWGGLTAVASALTLALGLRVALKGPARSRPPSNFDEELT